MMTPPDPPVVSAEKQTEHPMTCGDARLRAPRVLGGELAEVAVDGGPGDAELVGDLLDGVVAGVKFPRELGQLVVTLRG
jgi:hypothetical protein